MGIPYKAWRHAGLVALLHEEGVGLALAVMFTPFATNCGSRTGRSAKEVVGWIRETCDLRSPGIEYCKVLKSS